MSDLANLRDSIAEIYYEPSDLEDPAIYKLYHGYAEKLMQCLMDYTPILLKGEDFFKKVFYPELIH